MFKTERLTVKVLPTHRAALDCLSKAEGEPVAVIVRRLIRAEAERRGLWPALVGQGDGEAGRDGK